MIQYHSNEIRQQRSILRYAVTKHLGHNNYLLTEVANHISTTRRIDGWNEYRYDDTIICRIHKPHDTPTDNIPFCNTLTRTIRYEVCI